MLQWRIISGFPNYSVSNTGVIINTKKNKTMTIYTRKGYCLVKLSSNNKAVEKKVHRLIYELMYFYQTAIYTQLKQQQK